MQQPELEEQDNITTIRIFQINLNKSEKAHLELINNKVSQLYDIMLIQEPYTTTFAIRTPNNFRPVFPTNRIEGEEKVRSVIWVNKRLDTKNWVTIDITNTKDITAIQIKGEYGKITIYNIYNDCTHSRNETILNNHISNHENRALLEGEDSHVIWAGDFNRHHPLWDEDKNDHLFTAQALRNAEGIINMLAEHDMVMTLPKGVPTLQHMRSKRYSRLDNFFCTASLQPFVTSCEVKPQERPTSTDHFPIVTHIDLPQTRILPDPSYNFRTADWEEFRKSLKTKIDQLPPPQQAETTQQIEEMAEDLTRILQQTIKENIAHTKPCPDAKRWWNSDLRKLSREINKLRADSFRYRAISTHSSHRELRKRSKHYGKAIISAKRAHWTEYLENMIASNIWTANKYLKEPVGDGGNPRIPTIKTKDELGHEIATNDNEDKAIIFAKAFFPPPPDQPGEAMNDYEYPEPLPNPPLPTEEQITEVIRKLPPYKASGPDGIPNIVLIKCVDIIAKHLYHIYQAILTLGTYYDPWREFTTIVLRKPDKPNYSLPKAYRPIALISTMAKVLTSIVAKDMSRLVEQHNLLPANHFGGRPGRTTTDAIHYLVHKIKAAWENNKVASVLFLDVEGAFPNAVTSRLIHNLKKRRIPEIFVRFIIQLLANRRTKIKFDDYISEAINIINGIGQGDPLSMLLYIIYNADLLEIIEDELTEDAIGYVDDIAIIATGEDFEETTNKLKTLMTKQDGGLQWSKEHNSRFEITKSAILHATRKTVKDPEDDSSRIQLPKPPLIIENQTIAEVPYFKYLGIIIDSQLRWKEQTQRAVANATKWLLQYRRLTRTNSETSAKLMRQLYIAVALPKITYGLDIWYIPPSKPPGQTKNTGSAGALRQLQKTQRIASLAITGTLRTTPTDFADAHAGILPIELTLLKATHRVLIRLLTIPSTHPLYKIVKETRRRPPTKHLSPIASLLKTFGTQNEKFEIILPLAKYSLRPLDFTTTIAKSRKDSIKQEKEDTADFKIFSDGSGVNGGIGTAAILYKKGRLTPIDKLKAFIGPATKYNTYEAEIIGALLATKVLENHQETIGKRVSLFIDNQAVIMALSNPKATSGQYLARKLNHATNELNCYLKVKWISSHSKVWGNEKVDELAKNAAEGRSDRRNRLPQLLREDLPISASATKQEYHNVLKGKWRATWDISERSQRPLLAEDNFPFNAYRKRTYNLTRNQASTMTQIRSGHMPLNGYLHKIGKIDSDICQACNNEEDMIQRRETINHFIFECTAYANYRNDLKNKLGNGNFNLHDIMGSAKSMRALTAFINRTGRFKPDN